MITLTEIMKIKKKSHSCPKFLLFGSIIYIFWYRKYFLFKIFVLLLGVGAPIPLTPQSNKVLYFCTRTTYDVSKTFFETVYT